MVAGSLESLECPCCPVDLSEGGPGRPEAAAREPAQRCVLERVWLSVADGETTASASASSRAAARHCP